MMPRDQRVCTNRLKPVRNRRPRRFQRESLPPEFRPQMKPQFVNRFLRPAGLQPAASYELAILQQVNRPVLKSVQAHPFDLPLEATLNFLVRKRPAKISRDLNVSPQLLRQRKILRRPAPKPQPLTLQKIRIKRRVVHRQATGAGTAVCTPEPAPCTLSISAPTARNFSTIPSYPRSM